MASLVADYGTSSGSDSETHDDDDRINADDNVFKGNKEKEQQQMEKDDDEQEKNEPEEGEPKGDDNENDRENGHEHVTKTFVTKVASREKLPLPTPDFDSAPALLTTSVFSNPFVEAERAKSAILEKHVKMTPTLDDTKTINGRKICWNYRKGRCRFGHNCTFAHDSDLHRTASELEALRAPQETLVCQTRYNGQQSQQWQQQQQQQQPPPPQQQQQQQQTPTYDVDNNENDEVDQENNETDNNRKRKKRPGLSQSLLPSKRIFKLYKAQQKAVAR